ncbi:hypothetical protein [Bacillus sp. Marseille-P3800]|nr:hypothetical protein [Bacillus sp. Marseille-P3800]
MENEEVALDEKALLAYIVNDTGLSEEVIESVLNSELNYLIEAGIAEI